MPHVHTQPGQHDFCASAFIIRTDTPEPSVMLHLHRRYERYLQFGGHVELDEHPWRAALRELREESGYEPDQLQVLQPPGRLTQQYARIASHPLPFYFNTHPVHGHQHYHSDLVYAMVASGPPRHPIGEGESADIGCYTLAEIAALPERQIYDITRANASFLLENLVHDWQLVPAGEWPE